MDIDEEDQEIIFSPAKTWEVLDDEIMVKTPKSDSVSQDLGSPCAEATDEGNTGQSSKENPKADRKATHALSEQEVPPKTPNLESPTRSLRRKMLKDNVITECSIKLDFSRGRRSNSGTPSSIPSQTPRTTRHSEKSASPDKGKKIGIPVKKQGFDKRESSISKENTRKINMGEKDVTAKISKHIQEDDAADNAETSTTCRLSRSSVKNVPNTKNVSKPPAASSPQKGLSGNSKNVSKPAAASSPQNDSSGNSGNDQISAAPRPTRASSKDARQKPNATTDTPPMRANQREQKGKESRQQQERPTRQEGSSSAENREGVPSQRSGRSAAAPQKASSKDSVTVENRSLENGEAKSLRSRRSSTRLAGSLKVKDVIELIDDSSDADSEDDEEEDDVDDDSVQLMEVDSDESMELDNLSQDEVQALLTQQVSCTQGLSQDPPSLSLGQVVS